MHPRVQGERKLKAMEFSLIFQSQLKNTREARVDRFSGIGGFFRQDAGHASADPRRDCASFSAFATRENWTDSWRVCWPFLSFDSISSHPVGRALFAFFRQPPLRLNSFLEPPRENVFLMVVLDGTHRNVFSFSPRRRRRRRRRRRQRRPTKNDFFFFFIYTPSH